jgi:hypothetical protein
MNLIKKNWRCKIISSTAVSCLMVLMMLTSTRLCNSNCDKAWWLFSWEHSHLSRAKWRNALLKRLQCLTTLINLKAAEGAWYGNFISSLSFNRKIECLLAFSFQC